MKSKVAKILGVVLTTLMLVGVIPFAAPVMAGTQEWTDWGKVQLPSEDNLILAPNLIQGGPLAQSSIDGRIYAFAKFDDGAGGNPEYAIIVSSNHGSTWTRIDTRVRESSSVDYVDLNEDIIEIVCSPVYANSLFIITSKAFYRSTDSGVSFTKIIDVDQYGNALLSLDIGVNKGTQYALLGVNSASGPATGLKDGVYYWSETDTSNNLVVYGSAPFGAYDILAVKVAPTFGSNFAVVAVGKNAADGIVVQSSGKDSTWGLNTTLSVPSSVAADIAFPSDYNPGVDLGGGVMDFSDTNFVFCIAGQNAASGIYRIVESTTCDKILAQGASSADNQVWNNLSMVGNWSSGVLLAGGSNGKVTRGIRLGGDLGTAGTTASRVSFTDQTLPDYVTTATSWVLFDRGYLSDVGGGKDISYVLNVGGFGGGFSVGKGTTYVQRSLINDVINFIFDLAIANKDSGDDIFVITTDATDGLWTGITHASMWRFLASEGAWERIDVNDASGIIYDRLALSPNYATDNTIFRFAWAETGVATGLGNAVLQRSTTNGMAFENVTGAGSGTNGMDSVSAILPLGNNGVVVAGTLTPSAGGGYGIVTWTRSGTSWSAGSPSTKTSTNFRVTDLASYLNDDNTVNTVFAVGVTSNTVIAWKSADRGVEWTEFDTPISVTTGTLYDAVITPAADYGDTGNVFVGVNASNSGATTGAGIYRYADKAGGKTWSKVGFTGGVSTTSWIRDVVAAPGNGNVYEGTGLVYAIGANTYRVRGILNTTEAITPNEPTLLSRDPGRYSRILAVPATSGNVVLYSNIGVEIWTYTDTLGRNGDGLTVDPNSVITNSNIGKASATIRWNLLPNATEYTVKISPVKQTNLLTNIGSDWIVETVPGDTNYLDIQNKLTPDTVYYVTVWASSPVSSFMFNTATASTDPTVLVFTTNPTAVVHIYDLTPVSGATIDQQRPIFSWRDDSINKIGRTYTLQVSTTRDFTSSTTTSLTVPANLNSLEVTQIWPSNLNDGGYYYWRVAIDGPTEKEWRGEYGFLIRLPLAPVTVTQVAPPAITLQVPPMVTVTQNPVPVVTADVNVKDQNIVVTMPSQSTPVYIWVIVGVGALLTLAVIILIIRTRRVV
ncbi:MAG: hypothetical protein FWF98_00125 [Dehalococcoidia bacterium]|nr:hypothetical protein [Dehalococcoidia bacterium]